MQLSRYDTAAAAFLIVAAFDVHFTAANFALVIMAFVLVGAPVLAALSAGVVVKSPSAVNRKMAAWLAILLSIGSGLALGWLIIERFA